MSTLLPMKKSRMFHFDKDTGMWRLDLFLFIIARGATTWWFGFNYWWGRWMTIFVYKNEGHRRIDIAF